MWDAIYRLIERNANWPMLGLLFVLFLICLALFDWRNKVTGKTLEGSYWYTPAKASELLKAMDKHGRRVYAVTEVTLDLAFPFIYGGLFAILLFQLYGGEKAGWVLLIPVITVVADLLENFTAVYLALSFDGQPSPLAWAGTIFTLVKTAMFVLSLLLILVEAAILIITTDNLSG
jgi:hypothetical protein